MRSTNVGAPFCLTAPFKTLVFYMVLNGSSFLKFEDKLICAVVLVYIRNNHGESLFMTTNLNEDTDTELLKGKQYAKASRKKGTTISLAT